MVRGMRDETDVEMERDAIPCFDPRDLSQRANEPVTWKPTINPALIWATLTLDLAPTKPIDWKNVARTADLCEAPT